MKGKKIILLLLVFTFSLIMAVSCSETDQSESMSIPTITYIDGESTFLKVKLDNATDVVLKDTATHEFLGWYTQNIGGEKVIFPMDTKGNITIYARWQELESPILGQGSLHDSYIVATAEDFARFAKYINDGEAQLQGNVPYNTAHYLLTSDINLTGKLATIENFSGFIHGNNCIITTDTTLFNNLVNAEISDLTVVSSIQSSEEVVGVIANTAVTSKFANIKLSGELSAINATEVGGLVGSAEGCDIRYTEVDVQITANANAVAGGVVGYAYQTLVYAGVVKGSIEDASVAGGVVGKMTESALQSFVSSASVTADSSSAILGQSVNTIEATAYDYNFVSGCVVMGNQAETTDYIVAIQYEYDLVVEYSNCYYLGDDYKETETATSITSLSEIANVLTLNVFTIVDNEVSLNQEIAEQNISVTVEGQTQTVKVGSNLMLDRVYPFIDKENYTYKTGLYADLESKAIVNKYAVVAFEAEYQAEELMLGQFDRVWRNYNEILNFDNVEITSYKFEDVTEGEESVEVGVIYFTWDGISFKGYIDPFVGQNYGKLTIIDNKSNAYCLVADYQKALGTWMFGDDGRVITFSNTYDAEMSLYLAYNYGEAIGYYGAIICDYESNTYEHIFYVDVWDDLTYMEVGSVDNGWLSLEGLSFGIKGFPYSGNVYKNVWISENLEFTYTEDSNGNKTLIDGNGCESEFTTISYIEGVGAVVYAIIMDENWNYITYTIVDMSDHLEVYYGDKMERMIQIDYTPIIGNWSNGSSSLVVSYYENENGDKIADIATLDGVDYTLEAVVIDEMLCYKLTKDDEEIILTMHNDNYEIHADNMQDPFTPQMSYGMFDNSGYRMTIFNDKDIPEIIKFNIGAYDETANNMLATIGDETQVLKTYYNALVDTYCVDIVINGKTYALVALDYDKVSFGLFDMSLPTVEKIFDNMQSAVGEKLFTWLAGGSEASDSEVWTVGYKSTDSFLQDYTMEFASEGVTIGGVYYEYKMVMAGFADTTVEALIGITLDNNDVYMFSMADYNEYNTVNLTIVRNSDAFNKVSQSCTLVKVADLKAREGEYLTMGNFGHEIITLTVNDDGSVVISVPFSKSDENGNYTGLDYRSDLELSITYGQIYNDVTGWEYRIQVGFLYVEYDLIVYAMFDENWTSIVGHHHFKADIQKYADLVFYNADKSKSVNLDDYCKLLEDGKYNDTEIKFEDGAYIIYRDGQKVGSFNENSITLDGVLYDVVQANPLAFKGTFATETDYYVYDGQTWIFNGEVVDATFEKVESNYQVVLSNASEEVARLYLTSKGLVMSVDGDEQVAVFAEFTSLNGVYENTANNVKFTIEDYKITIGDSTEKADLVIKAVNGVTYIVVTIETDGVVTEYLFKQYTLEYKAVVVVDGVAKEGLINFTKSSLPLLPPPPLPPPPPPMF